DEIVFHILDMTRRHEPRERIRKLDSTLSGEQVFEFFLSDDLSGIVSQPSKFCGVHRHDGAVGAQRMVAAGCPVVEVRDLCVLATQGRVRFRSGALITYQEEPRSTEEEEAQG